MKWISFFLAMSALFLNAAFGVYKPHVIYGEDNRRDLYEVQNSALVQVSRSTAAMIEAKALTTQNGLVQIKTVTYGEEYQLCSEERFWQQPTAAMCSGFLVGENLLATAGHCLSQMDCADWAFVFNFAMGSNPGSPSTVRQEDVYFCQEVISREYTSKQDYVLVRLDRAVTGVQPLRLASQPAQALDPVVVVGHPSGLPTKVTDGAQVRATHPEYFVTNLDTYGGNSGSAVFNSSTLEVLGILVRGERDYSYDSENRCYRSVQCAMDSCRGEDVTHISYIRERLQESTVTYLD
ncbi:MAG: trypsin-like serine peptidase [Bdellovibrionales bacterium]